jgi:hypothetical protein
MAKIRIQGLVRTASGVRQALAGPVSPARLEQLKRNVRAAIQTVDQILTENGANTTALPAPSRRAYEFLASLDFDSIQPDRATGGHKTEQDTITIRGLNKLVESILDCLARADRSGFDDVYHRIHTSNRQIEQDLVANSIEPESLTDQSRSLRAWLAYFAERQNFDLYTHALLESQPIFEKASISTPHHQPPVLLHFKPMKGLCRLRRYANATVVSLPTPMICLDDEGFRLLAELAFSRNRHKQRVMERVLDEPYQTIRAELESLVGIREQTQGVVYDLGDAFDRVNTGYLGGQCARPCLTWSRAFTGRKFGHYDPVHDTVMISASLDSQQVPKYVVDYVVYHELLHKKHGANWSNGRRYVHTLEFKRDERRFSRYAEAEAVLSKLARA